LVRTNFSTAPILAALRAVGLKAYNRNPEFQANRGLIRDADMLGKAPNLPSDPKLAVKMLADLGYAPPSFPSGSLSDLIDHAISTYSAPNSANLDSGSAPPNPASWSSRAILESEVSPYTPVPPGVIVPPGAPVPPATALPPGAEPSQEVSEPELELTPLSSESAPGGVTVMTIHSAKGLEFKNVFVMGLFQGGVPYFEATSPEAIEEERRLFYVAITRAKSRLFLSYALSKHGGAKRPRQRSIFLDTLWPQ
jgi:hypothetical protein